MRLYVKCFHAGVMPGPWAWMRDRLVACAPRPISEDVRSGPVSSSIHARINERAGLTRDRALQFGAAVTERRLANGRTAMVGA